MEPAVNRRNDSLHDFKAKFEADATTVVKEKLLEQGHG